MSMFTRINKGLIAIAAALQLAVGLAAGPAHGASFDCAKAKSVMERTICADPTLSKLDEEMAAAYAKAKAELKDRPKELKKLVNSQREWLTLLKPQKSPCAARTECLANSYQARIKELQYTSAFARATSSTAVGPTQEVVMQRLNEQLEQLKSLVRSAKSVKSEAPLNRDKVQVCEEVWKKLPQATVPVPTEFANTAQQKQQLFEKVRQMAYDNQRLYFAQGNTVKDIAQRKRNLDYEWNEYRYNFELGKRKDAVCQLYDYSHSKNGFKQPIIVNILLDLESNSLSINRKELGNDGLWQFIPGLSAIAFSSEFYTENYEDKHTMPPSDNAGLIAIKDNVMLWDLNNNEETSWDLSIRPVSNQHGEREILCRYKVQTKSKTNMRR